jgi:hypothetical protein
VRFDVAPDGAVFNCRADPAPAGAQQQMFPLCRFLMPRGEVFFDAAPAGTQRIGVARAELVWRE